LIPRQRRIDASRLPGKKARFEQAWLAHEMLTAREWKAVGFDHFARPHDPLSLAAQRHRVRRNFQGFTDDPCEVLIGLGASAISRFRQSIVQNERNSGRYGIKVGLGHLAGAQGVATPPNEIMRAHSIEHWLCNGVAHLHYFPDRFRIKRELLPFEMAGLIKRDHWEIRLDKDGLPYARSVAAILDPWRVHSSTRFSNAV
jgi:oxygen-independent coproporphyrinogen-3 oxidase